MNTETRVLIIDDEKENVRYLTTILEENGFKDIHGAYDGEHGLERAEELTPGLILLDLRMPKKSGIDVFNELKKQPKYQDIPIIILTGEGEFLKHLAELREFHEDTEGAIEEKPTEEVLDRFITARPDAFLEKPIEPETLMDIIRGVLITLDEVKNSRKSEVNALRAQKLEEGVAYKGFDFASDEKTRNLLAAMAAKLALPDAVLPESFVWRSADNQPVPMTKEEVLTFHGAMTDWVYAVHKASWDHKAAINALTTIEEAENYDVQRAWPDKNL